MKGSLRLEVFHHLFAAAAEEMGAGLRRSAFSPNIRERRDFSCAIFDATGHMVAQAAHLPVHLGSAPLSVREVIANCELQPGDAVVLNDPFRGGTHLPDVTLVTPVFLGDKGRPDFFVANRAHHADIGGAFPGSMAPARDVHGEGLRIPPIHLVRAGEQQRDVLSLLLANMRAPEEREGDLLAQWSANRLGERRVLALADRYGAVAVRRRAQELMDWTERLFDAVLEGIPPGSWTYADSMEVEVADGGQARIVLDLSRLAAKTRGGPGLQFDFRASSGAVNAPINTTRAVLVSSVFYALQLLLPPGTPSNEGLLRRVKILSTPGSLLDARYPAPVAAGNVETSQRLVDVILGALRGVMPGRIPADSAGTMSNLTIGGNGFSSYETIAGGAGGGPDGAGAHALQTHMTNTRNTPIEAFERLYPARLLKYTVSRGSGGRGLARGGDGIIKRLRLLAPARVSWMAERQKHGPRGAEGGSDGRPGSAWVRLPERSSDRRLDGQAALNLDVGAELELRTPGGGGFGTPR